MPDASTDIEGLQTSTKAGKHTTQTSFAATLAAAYFNTEEELAGHERECRLAKQATPPGAIPCNGKMPHHSPKNEAGR